MLHFLTFALGLDVSSKRIHRANWPRWQLSGGKQNAVNVELAVHKCYITTIQGDELINGIFLQ